MKLSTEELKRMQIQNLLELDQQICEAAAQASQMIHDGMGGSKRARDEIEWLHTLFRRRELQLNGLRLKGIREREIYAKDGEKDAREKHALAEGLAAGLHTHRRQAGAEPQGACADGAPKGNGQAS